MRNLLTIVAASLGVAVASNAYGQTQDPDALIPVNVSVRLGIGLPLSNELRDFSSTLLAVGAEYQIDRSLLRSGKTYFALDFFKGDRSDTGYVIPFTINQRFFARQLTGGRRTYFFLGAGIGFLKGEEHWTQTFIGRGGVGADLGERIFLEGALTLGDKRRDISADNIGIYLGYRF